MLKYQSPLHEAVEDDDVAKVWRLSVSRSLPLPLPLSCSLALSLSLARWTHGVVVIHVYAHL